MTVELLREQWERLRGWLDDVDVSARRERPSGLDGWQVGDLVAHLGIGLHMLTEIRPDPDAEPTSFGRYVAAYQPAAPAMAEATVRLSAELGDDLLGGVDRLAAEAFAVLDPADPTRGGLAPVVLGRRGPL
ncbi:maleylpyruvate isomerase N-terminal domain-containing protein, partial [Desertihabitans aurantiacus]|uniref:maleylpyruvate isomerase N-terminal domain-containing protein n=1 Tax=Desertihabitans aurantiacus TaxID=2282477 RepID=UPI0018E5A339